MRRAVRITLVLIGLVLATRTSHAGAGGLNLSWDDCGPYGSTTKTFACNTNAGSNAIVCSAIPPVAMPQFVAMAATIMFTADNVTLPPWWTFDGCRGGFLPNPLSLDLNFVGGPFNCLDPWAGQASGGLNYTSGYSTPNNARFRMVCSVAAPSPLDGISENYFFRVVISNVKTTGAGSCAGCSIPMCIVLNQVELDQPAGIGDYVVTNPLNSQFVVWQSAPLHTGGCPPGTPTRNTTWGSIKGMYR